MPLLYQNSKIRQLESSIIDQKINTEFGLMQLAGQAGFNAMIKHWPKAHKISIYCGKGNNAGDGLVLAYLAHLAGLTVTIVTLYPVAKLSPSARLAAQQCTDAGITLHPYDDNPLAAADVIVDALLGSGIKGDIRAPCDQLVAAINSSTSSVLSLDIPSGIDGDTGTMLGCAITADVTVTFLGRKQGLYTGEGVAHAGAIELALLDTPLKLIDLMPPSAHLLDLSILSSFLPKRRRNAHKGDHGKVLVIGGDYGMGGAVRMAAEAAFRAGAGRVTVATRPEHLNIVSGARPEIICHQVVDEGDLKPLLAASTVVIIGPGLGQTEWAQELLATTLQSSLPKILDADALNLLSKSPVHHDNWILTPHPGEASRLLDITCPALQKNRYQHALQLQKKYGGVIVLKGAGTIIQADSTLPQVCCCGNPGMASAGMGDVLSGILGGLVAQGLDLAAAAEVGVLLHAHAADLAAQEGGERGLLATDLLSFIRSLVNPDD